MATQNIENGKESSFNSTDHFHTNLKSEKTKGKNKCMLFGLTQPQKNKTKTMGGKTISQFTVDRTASINWIHHTETTGRRVNRE